MTSQLPGKEMIEEMNRMLTCIHPCDNQEIEPDACEGCYGIFVDNLGDVFSCGHIKMTTKGGTSI